MSFLVVMIIDNPDDCPDILDGWEELGVSGITILESSGLGRVRQAESRYEMPLMPSLRDFIGVREEPHRTIFSVVKDQEMVNKMVAVSQEIIGNLDDPHTGFLFVVPVSEAYGLGRKKE